MKHFLEKLLAGKDLSALEAEQLLELLTSGKVPASQGGAALAALRMKG